MINKIIKIVLFSFLFLFFTNEGNTTHMVGGDFTYKCLGNGRFEITLTIRRDCYYGADDAEFDEKAIVAIFDKYKSPLKPNEGGILYLNYEGNDTLSESLSKRCGMLGDLVCVHEAIYKGIIKLPKPKSGNSYRLFYQRCCRNETLNNIENPLETGNSYMIEIDEYAFLECNQTPVFNKWPDIYICAGEPIKFDHSATDLDGDSLVYSLYTPFLGGVKSKPRPEVHRDFEKYLNKQITWANGYSMDNVFGSTDALKINSETGLITGTPDDIGQYLVGVQVEEYRNGKLMSTVRRDFEYNVRPCIAGPKAIIESVDAVCGSEETDTLLLGNSSQNADSYTWTIFNHSTGQTTVTNDFDASIIYTLPVLGKDTFDITLEAYSEVAKCSHDTTKRIIVVRDYLVADFDVEINDCYIDSIDITLDLNDKFDQLNPLYTWESSKWTVIFTNDTLYAEGKVVSITVPKEKKARVILEIQTEEKCEASIEKEVALDFAEIDFPSDTLVVCKGDQVKIVQNPNPLWKYTWEPEDGLDFGNNPSDKSNPTFTLDHDMKYYVTVTDDICTDFDSIQIFVKDYFDIAIEGPDSVCTDSVILKAVGGDGSSLIVFEWSKNSNFTPILTEGKEVKLLLEDINNKFFLRVKEGTGCSNNIDSISVYNGSIDLNVPHDVLYCTNFEAEIIVGNVKPGVNIYWEDNPIIRDGQNSNVLIIYTETVGEYDLVLHAKTEYGCDFVDTVHVIANQGPDLNISTDLECGTYTVCFGTHSEDGDIGLGAHHWDFGDLSIESDTSNQSAPCYTYLSSGSYEITLKVKIEDCGGTAILRKVITVPDIIEMNIETDSLVYCKGEEVTIIVKKNVDLKTVEWFSQSGSLGFGDTLIFYPEGDLNVFVVGSDEFGCQDTAKVFVEEYKYDITYVDPGVRCKGDTLELLITNNNGANLTFEWTGDKILSGGNTNNPTVVVFEDSDFEVKVTDLDYGCDSVYVVSVDVSEIDINIESDTTKLVITNPTKITVYNVPSGSTIEWSTGETNVEEITIIPTKEQAGFKTYCVTVTDEYGCSDEDCVEIEIIDPACNETDIYIPNAFSPNNDGNNDLFRVRGFYIRSVEIEIYDRWGELILKGNGDEFYNWDGKFRGKDLPPDVYTYRIHVGCEDSDSWTKQGNINLIK